MEIYTSQIQFTKKQTNKKTPSIWQISIIQPIFKKVNRPICSKYRGIPNSEYKIYAKILHEEQNGFLEGRSTIDDVFSLQQLIEKGRKFNQPTLSFYRPRKSLRLCK